MLKNEPHNIEAEQRLLGAILLNNDAMDRINSDLAPEHFYDALHGEIFDVANRLILSGRNASPVSLRAHFEKHPPISDDLTVVQYLGTLAVNAVSSASMAEARELGTVVRELAVRRNLILIAADLNAAAVDGSAKFPPDAIIEETEERLYSQADKGRFGQGFKDFSAALTEAIDKASTAFQSGGGLTGLSTGLSDLDDRLGGLQNSDLIILAGRPSMGKTALATNIGYNAAKSGKKVGFFSLEMSSEQLATRILSEQTEISSEKIRRGLISEDDFHSLVYASQELARIPLYIDHSGGITVGQLSARARKLKRQRGLDLLIVDYLQLLTGKGDGNRVQEVTQITTGLKALSKELDVPIIALSQLSRQVEQRENKRPQLSDLRESGSIEQDADVVMFVFREEYYVERNRPSDADIEATLKWQEEMMKVHGKAEAIIGKARHGRTGTVHLAFQAEYTRFGNLARDYRLPDEKPAKEPYRPSHVIPVEKCREAAQ